MGEGYDVHAADEVGDGFVDGVVASNRVMFASFVEKFDKLCRKPTSKTVQLSHPTMLVLLRDHLQIS